MRLGVDLRPLAMGISGGIAPLVQHVLEHAIRLYPEIEFLLFCTPFNRRLVDTQAANVRYFSLPLDGFYPALDNAARKEAIDVLFRSYPKEEALRFPAARQIFLIPDIQHEVYPQFFDATALAGRRLAFARALRSGGAIATISEFSRRSLLEFKDTHCEDVFLMEPGASLATGGDALPGRGVDEIALVPPQPFFLFPANVWPHKNHTRLLDAFRRFKEKDASGAVLVLTGHPRGWPELAARHPGLPVHHLGYVSTQLLRALYERALALAFFSLYEGFGMPLLDAFCAGTPVLCSNTTSLPEVGGDAVLSCDPTDTDAMAGLLERVSRDAQLRRTLAVRGAARLQRYAWDKAARALLDAGERVHARAATPVMARPIAGEQLPLVSIVTPSYQQGRFLRRAIESVLAQTYSRIEYVVVDGGSTDESVEILRSYGERLRWLSEPDRGQSHAINKGLAMTRGSIVAYLNSDDVLLPDAVQRAVQFLLRNPDCDLAYGNADYIDADDRVTGSYLTDEYSFERLMASCMICQPAAFWRRQVSTRIGPFDENLKYAMDYDYWLRIDRAGGKIQHIPDKLALSRLHKDAKTLIARADIHRECIRLCTRHGGYAHLNWFLGYWQHLLHERDDAMSRFFSRLPGNYIDYAWLHHRWHHGLAYFTRELTAFCFHWTLHRLGLARRRATQAQSDSRVTGYFGDNWLAPEVVVCRRRRASGEMLYIAGTTPVSLTVSVKAGGKLIARKAVEQGRPSRIEIAADALGEQPLQISFSDFIVDRNRRKLSFHLHETNTFSEEEVS